MACFNSDLTVPILAKFLTWNTFFSAGYDAIDLISNSFNQFPTATTKI